MPGAYYVGTAPGNSRPSYVRLSTDGRRLTTYLFAVSTRCSDGHTRRFALDEYREKRFAVAADGSFDHRSSTQSFKAGLGKNRISGRGSVGVTGALSGDEATITIKQRFVGKTSCNGSVRVTFRRVGSAGLPGNDRILATGPFITKTHPVLTVPRFTTVGPALLINGLEIRWTVAKCRVGRDYRDSSFFYPILLSTRGTFDDTSRQRSRLPHGLTARTKFRLTLRFRGAKANASWTATSGIYRRGKRIDTCRLPRTPFVAFRRGR